MAYKAIYRKWRPLVFDDIVGQSHITQALKNQISNGKIGHAYLFCGTRGTGKTTAAKILSKAVNCLSPVDGNPCNECEICRGIADGSIMDVIEIDAASNNGVDNIRELREDTKYVTASAKYRVYIIDEVHMLSDSAFNALLKTLEEPPEHVIFILATTEPEKVIQTIQSRCQRYDFKRIKASDIILRLKEIAYAEKFDITEDAYTFIARLGDGSMRDSISVLERIVSSYGDKITTDTITEALGIVPIDLEFDCMEVLLSGKADKIFEISSRIVESGKDYNVFIDALISDFRNLLVCKTTASPEKLLDYSDEELVRFKNIANNASYEKIAYIINELTEAKARAKWVKSPKVIYEMSFVKLCVPELDASNEAISSRVKELEDRINSGEFAVKIVEEKAEEEPKPKKEKKQVPTKLYNPIPKEELVSSNPIVVAAKKWDSIVSGIVRANPHLSTSLSGIPITIDADGIILLYKRKIEIASKNIADSQINLITELARRSCGGDLIVKTAYFDELEDNIIDFWAIQDNNGAVKKQENGNVDPLVDVIDRMEGFVTSKDDSEFLEFNREEENFSQESIDEREEFLEKNELDDSDE